MQLYVPCRFGVAFRQTTANKRLTWMPRQGRIKQCKQRVRSWEKPSRPRKQITSRPIASGRARCSPIALDSQPDSEEELRKGCPRQALRLNRRQAAVVAAACPRVGYGWVLLLDRQRDVCLSAAASHRVNEVRQPAQRR